MTTPPDNPASPAAAGRATSNPAPLVPTATAADPPPAGPDHVTVREIVEFLRDLAELRAGTHGDTGRDNPRERAAFLARKAELFTRIGAQHGAQHGADLPAPPPAEGRTP